MKRLIRLVACAVVTWAAEGLAFGEVAVPGQPPIASVDFERHVMGVLSKAGCNGGSCHGSFQGKNGFRLSLFGYDPAKDHHALTRDSLGRRIDVINPEQSLVLLKATGKAPHDGSVRFGSDSWQFKVVKTWIAGGAKWTPGSGAVADLRVDADELVVVERGRSRPLRVTARFADGSEEVVTAFCEFKVADDAVAEVTTLGVVSARQPGDTSLVVSYRGVVRGLRVVVPAELPPGQVVPEWPDAGFIDREVLAKLRVMRMIPAEPASDSEFLRRVTIDTIGTLPTPDEVRAFLADASPDKRRRKIDELLDHPLHSAVWATRFSDITGNNADALNGVPGPLRARYSQMWHDWLRKRFRDNAPFDEIMRGILVATSRDGESPKEWIEKTNAIDAQAGKGFETDYPSRRTLDLFWKLQNLTLEVRGEKVAAAFLGVRLECAQCHKHPTDRWTQADYRAFANLFQQVTVGASPETRELVNKLNAERREAVMRNNQAVQVREVFVIRPAAGPGRGKAARSGNNPGALLDPETNRPLTPKALGGPEMPIPPSGEDVRLQLADWISSPDNPFFARAFVNRVWAHYFGIGLVDPVDDFSVANPPTNARLLDLLAREFIASKFNIRQLERTILNSRVYQLSSAANASNRFDKNNFARSYLRPMMAETVVDVMNAGLGVRENFGNEAPPGVNMIEVGTSRINNPSLSYVLRIFGRPPRTSACDCERTLDPALPQTLYRMTDPSVLQKLGSPQGRLARLLKSDLTDEQILDELFLATLSRFPSEDERAAFVKHRADEKNRQQAIQDTLWALINTREFILQH